MITIKELRWSNCFSYGANNVINFVKAPETKAAVLLANWAATATLLLLLLMSASSIAAIAITTFMLLIETYAVFGNVEYTLAYAQARKMFVPS